MPATLRFDLVDLRLFLHVIDTGSITAGSKLSHLALASASARIRGMEDGLGVPLLERLRGGVKPTKAGLAVAHHARLVLQQIERMHGEIDDYAGGMAGKVRLLSNTAAITDYLPQALADFLNSHPAIDVELEERPSHLIVSQLLGQVADLGIVADSADVSSSNPGPSGATGWCWSTSAISRFRPPAPDLRSRRRWPMTLSAWTKTARCTSTWPCRPNAWGCACARVYGCAALRPSAAWWRPVSVWPWCRPSRLNAMPGCAS
jgi:DNA-binding transcriptional LysR family regulator